MEPLLKPEPKAPEEGVGMALYLHLVDLKEINTNTYLTRSKKKYYNVKVENISKRSLDLIPSPLAKIQIICGRVYMR